MIDYLVVGLGLAGISLCETLEQNGKTFKVINDNSQTSSWVAAGVYNPVILKRFTLAWNAKDQLKLTAPFYEALERKLNATLNHRIPIFRRFASIQEQNNWFQASDNAHLNSFLSQKLVGQTNPNINAPFGFGEVLDTGRIDTEKLVNLYRQYVKSKNRLLTETFDYSVLKIEEQSATYKTIKARRIVFAEGFGLRNNPFFNYLPLTGTKGELLKIKAPKLKENNIIKSSVFLVPIGDDNYKVGATYKWKDKTNKPTEDARTELLEKLDDLIQCDYTVIDQTAGIRPTVTDRRPLIGQHPEYKNLYLLNGLGSRGVMIAPYASLQLFNLMEEQIAVDSEIDISRFSVKYSAS